MRQKTNKIYCRNSECDLNVCCGRYNENRQGIKYKPVISFNDFDELVITCKNFIKCN